MSQHRDDGPNWPYAVAFVALLLVFVWASQNLEVRKVNQPPADTQISERIEENRARTGADW